MAVKEPRRVVYSHVIVTGWSTAKSVIGWSIAKSVTGWSIAKSQ